MDYLYLFIIVKMCIYEKHNASDIQFNITLDTFSTF